MANQLIHQHFEQFVNDNPSSRYEDWIANIHPESAEDGLLGLGDTIIDAKFYDPDNEYLKYWNSHLGPSRAPVKVASLEGKTDGHESDTSMKFDLLSGDGDEDSQSSPTTTPRKTVSISPGEDLMKFD
jgi:hypothetical protein